MPRSYYVLYNPASTHAVQSRRRIQELRHLVGSDHVHIIETSPTGRLSNRELLAEQSKQFTSDTVLCIAAGDGTVGQVVETLVLDSRISDTARQTPILPLWGGNANDLAHMLNGSKRSTIEKILRKSHVIRIYPLSCTLAYSDGRTETRVAACYMSFGATAYAAARLNKPQHRRNPLHRLPGGRTISEFAASFNGLVEAPVFKVIEDGEQRTMYERTFTNGSRFAKMDLLRIKLTDPKFFVWTGRYKHLGKISAQLVALLKGHITSSTRPVSFVSEDFIMAQFDGEPLEIPGGTAVTVSLAERPFLALSTKLGANE